MKKILTKEQINEIKQIEKTYPKSILMKSKEMAILNSVEKFPGTNESRHNKMLSDRAEKIFKELTFLLRHLPQSYTNKILASSNFNDFREKILNLNTHIENLDDKTKETTITIASQLFVDSLAMIKSSLPPEFEKPLITSARPFLEWLIAIRKYEQRNSSKNIPQLHIPNKLFSFTD